MVIIIFCNFFILNINFETVKTETETETVGIFWGNWSIMI